MKTLFSFLLLFSMMAPEYKDDPGLVSTSDIKNFWNAYDSVLSFNDSATQLSCMQRLYVDRASAGLREFMNVRNYSAQKWLKNIKKYPAFWPSVRLKTLAIEKRLGEIKLLSQRFRKLYPAFKPVEIYFTIGGLNTGGTVSGNKILIGAELICADSTVNASELSHWHQAMFRNNTDIMDWLAHEIGHTQQKDSGASDRLLNACIYEGTCDFLSELLLKKTLVTPYISYGKAHHDSLFEKFDAELDSEDFSAWLYNGDDVPEGQADLGYYIGYALCKNYYQKGKNKAAALKEIIELNYSDPDKVMGFYRTGRKTVSRE